MDRITIKIRRDIKAEIEALKTDITMEKCDTVNKVLAYLIKNYKTRKEDVE